MKCRHCHQPLVLKFLDLGFSPPSNAYLTQEALSLPETYYPLRVFVCTNCWLVQTEDFADAGELFSAVYAYFSSTSTSWLKHAKKYVEKVTARFGLDESKFVVEVASNDGYLLTNFVEAGIPCLGIEPTSSTAEVAKSKGVPVIEAFFGEVFAANLAGKGQLADLIIGNNVFAHVPDVNDFTAGLRRMLKPEGVITLEFPHFLELVRGLQFDTVYHEHFSYLSLYTVAEIMKSQGLRVFDVEKLSTHGGSLRVYICHESANHALLDFVAQVLDEEFRFGLRNTAIYAGFQTKAEGIKNDLLAFLIEQKQSGKKVVAYGAAAKGNTLLNFAGVKPDLLPYVCDAAPSKQGKFMPGSHIEISAPQRLFADQVDFVLVLPWNILTEVQSLLNAQPRVNARLVRAVPCLEIV